MPARRNIQAWHLNLNSWLYTWGRYPNLKIMLRKDLNQRGFKIWAGRWSTFGENILNATGFIDTKMSLCFGCCGFLWLFRIWICVPSAPWLIFLWFGNLRLYMCALLMPSVSVCMRACAPLLPRCERRSLCIIWRLRGVAYTKFPPAEVMAPSEKRLL